MNLITDPAFSSLPANAFNEIIRYSGNISNLSIVCRLFKDHVEKAVKVVLINLVKEYGKPLLSYVFKHLSKKKASKINKIDTLFFAARHRCLPLCQGKESERFEPYSLLQLNAYLEPFVQAESLVTVWDSIIAQAPKRLKQAMLRMRLSPDLLIKANKMRGFFQKNLQLLDCVQNLDLSKLNLRTLPEEIMLFTNLLTLEVSNNKLVELPSGISKLTKLTDLMVDDNCLTSLPKEIGELKFLVGLSCVNNQLAGLPDEIGDLSHLEVLILNRNLIRDLPSSIGKLSSLQILSLESNQLEYLPDTIGSLNLEQLFLYNNSLTTLPESIGQIKSLLVLSAPQNLLSALPETISDLQNLKILMLADNYLVKLPKNLSDLKKLEELYLDENPAVEVPDLHLRCFGVEGILKTSPFQRELEEEIREKMVDPATFLKLYGLLNEEKWKECIDGSFHQFGRYVFDQGLHKGPVEPGFLKGMLMLFDFLRNNFGRRIDACFYLEAHKVACSHFQGASTQTFIGQEQIGMFRGDAVYANFNVPEYQVTSEAEDEFSSLSNRISSILGPSFFLGTMKKISNSPEIYRIEYASLTQEQVKVVFNLFVSEFYSSIFHAKDDSEILIAIAKLVRNWEWLHPPKDGCGRTDTAFLNFLLTSFGYNPALLIYPYVSSCRGLLEWVQCLRQGIQRWLDEALLLHMSLDAVGSDISENGQELPEVVQATDAPMPGQS